MSLLNSRMVIIAVASTAMCGLLLIETILYTQPNLLCTEWWLQTNFFDDHKSFGLRRMGGGAYNYNRLFSSSLVSAHLLLEFPGRRKSNKQSYGLRPLSQTVLIAKCVSWLWVRIPWSSRRERHTKNELIVGQEILLYTWCLRVYKKNRNLTTLIGVDEWTTNSGKTSV